MTLQLDVTDQFSPCTIPLLAQATLALAQQGSPPFIDPVRMPQRLY